MPKEKDVMDGGPEDDPIEPDPNEPDDEQTKPNDDKKPVYVTQEQLQGFQTRQDKIFQMLEGLTKKSPAEPEKPSPKAGAIAGMTPEEFEQLFWDNPAAALEKYKASILTEIRTETGKTQSAQTFWNDFYSDNEDLKKDSDLVQLVLNQNMASLADLPVAEAKVKLADLTRQRILRYSGDNKGGDRKRVVVEGSQHRLPKDKPAEPEAPKTLGELIRARKAARRGNGKAMAT